MVRFQPCHTNPALFQQRWASGRRVYFSMFCCCIDLQRYEILKQVQNDVHHK